MPQQKKLPDTQVIVRLREKGMQLKEIGQLYGVGEGTVWAALNAVGHTTDRHTFKEILPWEVEQKHKTLQMMEQFRRIVKLRHGQAITDVDRRRLARWLTSMQMDKVILTYHPDAPGGPQNAASPVKGGFYYVPREESDGDAVIRVPDGADVPVVNITDVLDMLHPSSSNGTVGA